jgi:2-polyprenyl-3-methyl-5-hydroxy-6-metoxy-1,4-benzoquinol methylase
MLPVNCVEPEIDLKNNERIYRNQGNLPLVSLLDPCCKRVLDIGCGAGDNAKLIKSSHPACEIYGVTQSASEADIAQVYMKRCWVANVEQDLPEDLLSLTFDAILFSHVLEHLREPAEVLRRISRVLRVGGQVLIAVPNVLSWRMRFQFLKGDFQYQSAGVLDDTHLHFYTYLTAAQTLLGKTSDLKVILQSVTGSVPLWLLRQFVLPGSLSRRIDDLGCRYFPNIFGVQVNIIAERL